MPSCRNCYFYDRDENPCNEYKWAINDGYGVDYFVDDKDIWRDDND